MNARKGLILLFAGILLCMLCVTGWASFTQPVWEWSGLTRQPDHAWTIATLCDAYCGLITFYVWVAYKEPRTAFRVVWFVAIMLLGNMAMAAYMLKELRRLQAHRSFAGLLTRRND
jgi:hypothetical protein